MTVDITSNVTCGFCLHRFYVSIARAGFITCVKCGSVFRESEARND